MIQFINYFLSKRYVHLTFILLLFATTSIAQISVTATQGSTSGTVTTLKQVFDSINAGTYRGQITLSLTGNTTETASAVLNASGSGLASYTRVLIQPSGGAARTISGSIAGPLIDLNGADSVIINGLNTGGNALNLTNSSASGVAIRFINDASQNIVQNANIKGAATSVTSGVIVFLTGTLTGNDNNIITGNTIDDASGFFPNNIIYSAGTTTAGVENSNNQLLNNNISNYYNGTSASNGVLLNSGSTDWIISGNRLYQTSARVYTAATAHRGINVLTGNGHIISNNIIGFASSASTGIYGMSSTASITFIGIDVTVGTTTSTSIQGNRISSISMTAANTAATGSGALCGIRSGGGNTNIGTVVGNIIGDTVGTGSLTLNTTVSTGTVVGINIASANNTNAENNRIGGLTSLGSTATIGSGVFGFTVSVVPVILNINNNTIGNATAHNMVAGIFGTTTAATQVAGITAPFVTNATVIASYSGNIIRNLTSYGSGSGFARGIMTNTSGVTGSYTVNGNTIFNITTNSILTSVTSGLTAAAGIHFAYGLNPVISNNTIFAIAGLNTAATQIVICGIALASATNITAISNRIYDLSHAGTGTGATTPSVAAGIVIRSGTTSLNIINNMISLGVGQSTNTLFTGIQTNAGSSPNPITNIWNNTVHIGGTATTGALPSFCYVRQDFALTSARTITVDIRNNLFVNTRTGGTGKHYAISNNYGVAVSNVGWPANSSNFNILNSANPATVANWGGTADLSISGWRSASLCDTNSYSGITVNFVNPANDLHLSMGTTPTYLESNASTLSQVTTDFDGQVRPGPAGSVNGGGFLYDFGADEFDGVSLDGSAPIVNITPLSNTNSVTSRIAPALANILDARIDTAASTRPRIYYKKRSEANAFVGNTSADNGWKFTEATNTSSPFSFQIDYSLLTSAPAVGDTIQYFVVAQDLIPLVTASPSAGFAGTGVASITAAPSAPLSYVIVAGPMAGTYTVGTGQSFATLTEAINNVTLRGVSAPVRLVLKQTLYDSTTGEIFPIVLSNYSGASSVNTVIVMPDTGVFATIIGNNAVTLLDFNGCSYYNLDGRPGGFGSFVSGNNLIISNANTIGNTLRFINTADSNTIYQCDIRGANTTAAGTANAGVINFSTTTGTMGNDLNTIRACHIRESVGFGFPSVAVNSIGSGTTVAQNNEFITIDSCEIYNFYHPSNATAAIHVGANNAAWQINANKFYQTSPRSYTSAVTHRILWITPNTANLTSASGFVINNNFIGGNNSLGTGTYAMSGSGAFSFSAMDLSVGLGTPTSVQGNTITNISDSSSSTASNAFCGINLANGNVNCGNIAGNILGSRTANGAITYTLTGATGGLMGIRTGGGTGNTFNISNNIISGFDLYGNATTIAPEFFGINLFNSTIVNCTNNMIGDTTLPNSIQVLSQSATSTTPQRVSGIFANPASGTPTFTISNNLICNIRNSYSATGSQAASTRGIVVNPTITGTFTVTNNRISNISTSSQTTSGGATSALVGISVSHTIGNTLLSGNTIHSLALTGTSTTAAVGNVGIFYSTPTTGTNTVNGNFIHSQTLFANNPFATITGIDVAAGNPVVTNNMIRMGIDSSGSSVTTACTWRGITKNVAQAQVYFNTVYIGGSGVNADPNRTFAFQRTASASDDVRNNIFINQRTNASGGGGHFAVSLNNTNTLVMNNNLLRADTIGLLGSTPYTTLPNWKAFSGVDVNSLNGTVPFINSNGSATSVDLRINSSVPTPTEAVGSVVSGPNTGIDFEGQLRSTLTPIDLGADAGNFIPSDLASPVITYTPLTNTLSTANRVLSVNITDATGIYLTGSLRPRIYYRKNANPFISDTGIFMSGNAVNSNWNFTLNSTNLGGLSGNDSVYYFIVAQDSAFVNNLGSEPGGAEGLNVNSITTFPLGYGYKITPVISGTFLVGNGQTFPNLTGTNGIFSYINTSVLGGNVVIQVTSDIEEPGTNALNEFAETGSGRYMVRIEPDAAILRNITGTVSTAGSGLIRLSGADRVVIDGSFAGTGKFLRFMNRPQAGVTFLLNNDAQRDTIRNCIIEGVNNTTGIILFGGSSVVGGTGNDSNALMDCIIRDTLGTIAANNIPNTGISSSGTTGLENDFITIDNNEIFNFGFNAINMNTTGTGNNWRITNNKIYQIISKNNAFQIVLVQGGSGHFIANNSIGGAAADRSGIAFQTTGALSGIILTAGVNAALPITITNNTISNLAATGTAALNAILVSGGNTIVTNNTLGGAAMPYDTLLNGQDNGAITVNGGTTVLVENNLIGNMYFYRNALSRTAGITITTSTASSVVVQNNTIRDILANSTGSTTSSFRPVGIAVTSAPPSGLIITRNNIRNIQQTNTGTAAYVVSGIMINAGTVANVTITRNRIKNIGARGTGTGTTGPVVHGINVGTAASALVANNQIALGDSAINESIVYGISDFSAGTNTYAYNSIFINGTNVSTSNISTGFFRNTTTSTINFRNNIVYNKRIPTVAFNNYAVTSVSATGVTGANINYNLFIVNDTARLAMLPTGVVNSWTALNTLYTTTYNTNWAESVTNIPAENLYTDTAIGDLSINISNPASWYANGKGIRIPGISDDYSSATGVRSTSLTSGATDIGSVEFTPTTAPPSAFADKAPAALDSTQFYFGSRLIAKAVWGTAGTVPGSVSVRYYSGTNPANTPVAASFSNAYYDIQQTGGSGFTYALSLMLDSNVVGNINTIANTQIANYTGPGTNWFRYNAASVNALTASVTTGSVAATGIFTFTDSAVNPLPVKLVQFSAVASGTNALVSWTTASEINHKSFVLLRSFNAVDFEPVYTIFGNGNSMQIKHYNWVDNSVLANNADIYYRLAQTDMDGTEQLSEIIRVSNRIEQGASITPYPNPFIVTTALLIQAAEAETIKVTVCDLHGKVVDEFTSQILPGASSVQLDKLAEQPAGIYFVKVTGSTIRSFKVVKY
jgi:hypothetical protein